MTYKEQLKHPKWQKKRLGILKRDGFKCFACFNEEIQLHVHHLEYIKGKKAWQYKNKNLITLCSNCHTELHKEIEYQNSIDNTYDLVTTHAFLNYKRLTQVFLSKEVPFRLYMSIVDHSDYFFLKKELVFKKL